MIPVSVVIITKNEAHCIADCIGMAKLITDNIILVDNGSTDSTLHIAAMNGCRVFHHSWEGYGANKNFGISLAKYDWILSLDADEVPDMELVNSLHNLWLRNPEMVYDIRFKSYFGDKQMRFGTWGRDHHVRLFNRTVVRWSETIVHETLVMPKGVRKKKLSGHIHHHSVSDAEECCLKATHYAKLSAEKYFQIGRRSNFVNMYLSPFFVFVKNYFFLLGFLDGRQGWAISRTSYKNRWLKYHYLNLLETRYKNLPVMKNNFAVDVNFQ
jgi:glycosyltransferase involved in cell wall biosynthesis